MEDNYAEMSEVDIAWQILSKSGKENPLHFKKLILDIIAKKNKVVQNEAAAISEIYTMINMDSRFQHIGDGFWGLTDWYPPETKRGGKRSEKTSSEKKNSANRRSNQVVDEESKSIQDDNNNRKLEDLKNKMQIGAGGVGLKAHSI